MLGRVIRKGKEAEDTSTPKTLSIVDAVDNACAGGVTAVGAFSLTGMKRTTKEIVKHLDDFNREAFFVEMFKLYNLAMAPDVRAKNVFHPSSLLEDCPRKLTYDLLKTPPSDITYRGVTGGLQRIFDVGTWYHLYLQNILYKIGLLENSEVPVVNKDRFINGKADGLFKFEVFGAKTVLEIKSMNSFMYSKAIFRPFKKHEAQASLYAKELGATMVLYLYINKDTSEMKEFLMPLHEEMLGQQYTKIDKVVEHVKAKTLPPRTCADKVCDKALACPFRTLCFK